MYSNPETREKKDDGNYVKWDTLHSAAVVRSWLCGHASAEHPASTLDMHNFYLSINYSVNISIKMEGRNNASATKLGSLVLKRYSSYFIGKDMDSGS